MHFTQKTSVVNSELNHKALMYTAGVIHIIIYIYIYIYIYILQNPHSRKHGQQRLTFDWAKLRVTTCMELMQAPSISPSCEIVHTWSVILCSMASYLKDMISWILTPTPSRNLVPRSEGLTFVPTFCSLRSLSLIRCCK